MITRAQAEALLTLAESLEACERQGVFPEVEIFIDKPHLLMRLPNGGFQWQLGPHGELQAMNLRYAVAELLPRSEPNDNCRGLGVDHRPVKSNFSDRMFCSKCGDEIVKHTGS